MQSDYGNQLFSFYRPQMKFAKVMFLHLSVSHSVHRGGVCGGEHTWQGGHEWQGGMHGRWGVCGRGVCGRGVCGRRLCMLGGMHGRGRRGVGLHGRWGVSMGVSMTGGIHGTHATPPPCRYYEIWSYGQWVGGTHPTIMYSCYFICT